MIWYLWVLIIIVVLDLIIRLIIGLYGVKELKDGTADKKVVMIILFVPFSILIGCLVLWFDELKVKRALKKREKKLN